MEDLTKHNGFWKVSSQYLRSFSLFHGLDDHGFDLIINCTRGIYYPPEKIVVQVGDPGSYMFLIYRGTCNVEIDQVGKHIVVRQLKDGDFFGEGALYGEKRDARIRTKTQSHLIVLSAMKIDELFSNNPDLKGNFYANLAFEERKRVRRGNEIIADLTRRLRADPQ